VYVNDELYTAAMVADKTILGAFVRAVVYVQQAANVAQLIKSSSMMGIFLSLAQLFTNLLFVASKDSIITKISDITLGLQK
jgi:hypothetical protein